MSIYSTQMTVEPCAYAVQRYAEKFQMGKKVFLVTGRQGAKLSGALDEVIDVLNQWGILYEIFSEICENPPIELVYEAGEKARLFGAEFVIGIGGGSAIDAAKAIACFAENPQIAPMDLLNEKIVKKDGLPVIAIPTTAGTGSEANAYSILTIDSGRRKATFRSASSQPVLALTDYRYTQTLSREYSVSCALDALAHALESYLSPKSNVFSETAALNSAYDIWKVLFCDEDGGVQRDVGGFTERQRERLMYASHFAGKAIAVTGTGFPHPMGYNLTLSKGIPHGCACAVFEGEYLRLNGSIPEAREKLQRLYDCLGTSEEEMVVRIPELSGVSVVLTDEEIEDFVTRTERAANYRNSPYVLERQERISLYQTLFQIHS